MRIAIDAMGGDRAPAAPVRGALRALEAYEEVSCLLVGDPARLQAELASAGEATSARLEIHDAPEPVDPLEEELRPGNVGDEDVHEATPGQVIPGLDLLTAAAARDLATR